MKHESEITSLNITATEECFETWVYKSFVTKELRERILDKDILIVPYETYMCKNFPVFPDTTVELFKYIESKLPDNLSVEVCIEDDDYKEVSLHYDLVILGSFIVTTIAAPVLAGLLQEYIRTKIFKPKETHVQTSIIIQKGKKKSVRIDYEGPVENFDTVVDKTKELL